MDNSEKTLDQLVALCKGRGFVYPALRFTAVLQIHGTTVRSALNLRKTSKSLEKEIYPGKPIQCRP